VRSPVGWELFQGSNPAPSAAVRLDQETAWKLFSKGLDRNSARGRMELQGDVVLGETVLDSLAIMA